MVGLAATLLRPGFGPKFLGAPPLFGLKARSHARAHQYAGATRRRHTRAAQSLLQPQRAGAYVLTAEQRLFVGAHCFLRDRALATAHSRFPFTARVEGTSIASHHTHPALGCRFAHWDRTEHRFCSRHRGIAG